METARIYGTVFIPGSPDMKIPGAWLTISPTSILLEINFSFLKGETWPIILGSFHGLDKVTFVNCRNDGGALGAGGTFTRIRASYCIKSGHFREYSGLLFKQVRMFSPALRDWIVSERAIAELDERTYRIPLSEEIVVSNIEETKLLVEIAHQTRLSESDLTTTRICMVSFISGELKNIDVYSDMMTRLKKFILFITNRNPEFDKYYLVDGTDKEYELLNTNDQLREDKFTMGIDIQFSQVKNFLNKGVEKWFAHEELHPVIDLVLEKNFNTEMSMHGLFLNMCVALESFHGKFGKGGKGIINPVKEANREKILTLIQIDPDVAAWFEIQSAFWKNPTLKDRLNQFSDIIMRIKGDTFVMEVDMLISKVVQTRNDIAHSGVSTKRFNYSELFIVAKIIEYTIRLEVLKLMEFDIDATNRSIIENARASIDLLARLNKIKQ